MRILFLSFLLLFISSVHTHAQHTDSLKLAEAFNKALTSPDERETYLQPVSYTHLTLPTTMLV